MKTPRRITGFPLRSIAPTEPFPHRRVQAEVVMPEVWWQFLTLNDRHVDDIAGRVIAHPITGRRAFVLYTEGEVFMEIYLE